MMKDDWLILSVFETGLPVKRHKLTDEYAIDFDCGCIGKEQKGICVFIYAETPDLYVKSAI